MHFLSGEFCVEGYVCEGGRVKREREREREREGGREEGREKERQRGRRPVPC